MSRKLFTAGCVVLVALGLVHLLGHAAMQANQGESDAERQMLSLMRGHRQDLGLGFVRSMSDIVNGFSLHFSVASLGMGLCGFVVRRHARAAAGLLRHVAIVYAVDLRRADGDRAALLVPRAALVPDPGLRVLLGGGRECGARRRLIAQRPGQSLKLIVTVILTSTGLPFTWNGS